MVTIARLYPFVNTLTVAIFNKKKINGFLFQQLCQYNQHYHAADHYSFDSVLRLAKQKKKKNYTYKNRMILPTIVTFKPILDTNIIGRFRITIIYHSDCSYVFKISFTVDPRDILYSVYQK